MKIRFSVLAVLMLTTFSVILCNFVVTTYNSTLKAERVVDRQEIETLKTEVSWLWKYIGQELRPRDRGLRQQSLAIRDLQAQLALPQIDEWTPWHYLSSTDGWVIGGSSALVFKGEVTFKDAELPQIGDYKITMASEISGTVSTLGIAPAAEVGLTDEEIAGAALESVAEIGSEISHAIYVRPQVDEKVHIGPYHTNTVNSYVDIGNDHCIGSIELKELFAFTSYKTEEDRAEELKKLGLEKRKDADVKVEIRPIRIKSNFGDDGENLVNR